MPIRWRLALYYGGLAFLCCAMVTMAAYAAHTRAHYDDLDRALRSAAEHVVEEYTGAGSSADLAGPLAVPAAPDAALRVYGPGGQVLAESPSAGLVPPVDPGAIIARPSGPPFDPVVRLAPALISEDPGRGAFGLTTGPDGHRWRLYVLPTDGSARFLLAAAPLERIDASVARFRLLVALLVVAGAGLTFVAAVLLAGRALRPVAALTETAAAIARSRGFDRRVAVGPQQDELGRLAATFNEMLASLERAYRSEQRFVSDASHELRAPLTAIQANLELLERRPNMPTSEQQEAVGEAAREARRLAVLVADLLMLARADAGVPLRRQLVELDRVVLDVLGEARHLARGQRFDVAKLEPALVEGDPDRLRQLLLILLDNALKYTPPTGQVTLGLSRNGTAAEVTVRDTGVGIAAHDLPHVFERFYRADPARARDPSGTGLGLPIARWIAEQHGGELTLASEPEKGTIATVRLPVGARARAGTGTQTMADHRTSPPP
ncbi:MAG: two-component sensor histidine kinase [Dehalococcoidia bacterium]|nr:MAG: two-component sensor histidine kinase [Dehalococcoidia bacterium]